jgi:hypothetical protein
VSPASERAGAIRAWGAEKARYAVRWRTGGPAWSVARVAHERDLAVVDPVELLRTLDG